MKLDKIRVAIFVIMLLSLSLLARKYIHFSNMHQWPIAEGKLISYDSGEHSYVVHTGVRMQSTGSVEWSRVTYEYSINGAIYQGNKISPNIMSKYENERKLFIPVYYSPNDHSESYLLVQRYYNPFLLGLFVASIIVLVFDVCQFAGKMHQ